MKLTVRTSLFASILSLLGPASALHFYLEAGPSGARCFLEELPSATIVEGHYKALEFQEGGEWIINPAMGIQISVEEVATSEQLLNVNGKPEGKFTFTSHEPGDHSICLQTNGSSGWFSSTSVKFYLDIAVGSAASDPQEDSSHITTVSTKLRDLNAKVEAIKQEQRYQREIEAVFRDASELTNSRAVWWSLAQLVVLLGMGWWQMKYLKVFFEDKKLR